MKKIATLLLAAGLLFSAAGMAQAIDIKIRGQWIMAFDYGEHGAFTGGNGMTGYKKGNEDNFEARQRLRLQLDAVASENLSGSVIFEMGDQIWGQSATGGALGADGTVVEVKNAWLDWMVPDTDIKVRMGLQGFFLPSMTTGSQVWGDDAAGITASWQINENVALTALWARLYNDNFQGYGDDGLRKNYMDNVDVAALLLPLTFDGFRLTPWAMYAGIGPNSLDADHANDWKSVGVSGIQYLAGMLPAGGASHNSRMDLYGNAFWAGLTGELTLLDPWRIAWDLNYGSVSYDDTSANRAGWLASLLVEYDLGWTKPGIYGWYASGDDDDRGNGSERMPYLSVANVHNAWSHYAFNGNEYISREGAVGNGMTGTWGVGLQLRDVNVIEDLYQTFRVNLIGGTNDPGMAKWLSSQGLAANSGALSGTVGMDGLYLTRQDYALEWGLTSTTKVTENFTVALDVAYVALWLDHDSSVWGNSRMNGRNDEVRDAWNFSLSYMYSF